ncbi:alpha/beta fold hydrolase [Dyella subtropica]|uniref:alpha/beta fold hydrolase n=1 Tax=Dyella subtropica TaxID=2992127 RepID=UPI00224CAA76|nr:alpha/beta hydrolase [Dyella subtropica]
MKRIPFIAALAALSLIVFASSVRAQGKPISADTCSSSLLGIDGNQIWVNKEGAGNVTVVFESGFGNDSGVWSQIAPRIRAVGTQTFVYDRAGMGKSTIDTAVPYSLDHDVHILRKALTDCGIKGPVVMVGHSYGGAISLLAASEDQRIKGLVLLDAVVPGVWPKSEVDKNLKMMRAQYAEVRAQAPGLAKVAIPWAEAMPETAKKVDSIRVSATIPIVDIVAEKGQNDPESTQIWRGAHMAFTANNPHREYLFAAGSSHKVMIDKPDLVVEAIEKMVEKSKGL